MSHCPNPDCLQPFALGSSQYCQGCGNLLKILRGRYRPLFTLGQGGFGRTFLAEDLDRLNKRCVIKQFFPDFQDPHAFQIAKVLFEKEAQQLQHLGEHSRIPSLYAYFEEDDQLYLVQQYVPGKTLEQELQEEGKFTEAKVITILQDVLETLVFIHKQKIIHRDIKPSNIIHSCDPITQEHVFFIIDFGIAKQLTPSLYCSPGTMVGSQGYAPKEQMEGGIISPASDLYSLGITCIQLLTRKNPRELDQQLGANWIQNWRTCLPQPLSPQLDGILGKLLSADMTERFQSASQVLSCDLFSFGKQQQASSTCWGTSASNLYSLKTVKLAMPPTTVQVSRYPQFISQFLSTGNVSYGFLLLVGGGLMSLLITIYMTSPIALIRCQFLRDCGLDQHLQKVYAKAKYNAEQAVQSATTDNGLHELQKNQETLNKSIAILETLPRDAKVSPQLDQEIKVYRQQLNLLSNLISKQQALNKSLAPIPYSAAPQLPPKTGHSPQVSTNLNDSKPAYRPESSSRRAIRRTKKLSTNSKIARTNGRKKASRSIPKPSKTLEPLWGEGAKNSSLEPLW